MDGLNHKISGDLLRKHFDEDMYGSLIPKPDSLRMSEVAERVERQLSADTGLAERLTEMYYKADVEFTDNPLGNTPALGAGIRLFGPRVFTGLKFAGRVNKIKSVNDQKTWSKKLEKRERKIARYTSDLIALHNKLKPVDMDTPEGILWLVEGDQALTGGGFDNNSIGEVAKSAINFIAKGNRKIDYRDTRLSQLTVEGSLWLRDHLKRSGIREGSITPDGATKVRFDQDTDGMIAWPVYAKANAPLTKDIATRLLIETGVSTIELVGSEVRDKNNKLMYKFRVIDAIAYILDRLTVSGDEHPSIVSLLARIQKHGYNMVDGKLVAKPGKTRSVYPNAAIPGIREAMIMAPFMRALKEHKVSFMPSLQNKPTRVDMLKTMITEAFSKDYDLLAADWSKYDATVIGSILATVMHIAVRPFINARYHSWLDAAIYSLTFKYILVDESLASIHNEEYSALLNDKNTKSVRVEYFRIFGMTDGLISGAKFTHGGGSMYGEVVIHYVIPKLLGYEPLIGAQAGDDTLLAIPKTMIDIGSSKSTYSPIEKAASQIGLEMNVSKQIWHNVKGEVVKVFLQENYHVNTDVWGIGTIFRPAAALFVMERDKGLSISEQMIAEIARMNQGSDSPFVDELIRFWFERERFLGTIFKDYGVNAYQLIIDSIGLDIEQIAQRIDVGSFSWGISKDDMRSGRIPILPHMARVAATMSFDVDSSTVLETLKAKEGDESGEEDYPTDLELD